MSDIIRKGYVDVTDGQLHYRVVAGEAEPPIVYFHQTASSSQMFEKIMRLIAHDRQQYAMDTPAFGQSFFPPLKPTTRYYVDTLLEGLTNLGVERFHAFGHHTGACIATEMAVVAPERVVTLGLVGPAYFDANDRAHWRRAAVDPLIIKPDGSHLMKIWARVTGLDPDPSPVLCHREAIDTLRAGERWHEAYAAVFDQDFPAFLAQVRCPILQMCSPDDVLWPYFEAAKKARPDAKAVVMPGGTYVCDDFPKEVADQIRAFLEENA